MRVPPSFLMSAMLRFRTLVRASGMGGKQTLRRGTQAADLRATATTGARAQSKSEESCKGLDQFDIAIGFSQHRSVPVAVVEAFAAIAGRERERHAARR